MHYGRDSQAHLLTGAQTGLAPRALPKTLSGTSAPTAGARSVPGDSLRWLSDRPQERQVVALTVDDDAAVFERLVGLKLASSDYTVHLEQLSQAWRAGLFRSLDHLLDADEWDFSDAMPTVASFKTFLRMIVHNQVKVRPGLGATSDGRIVASWRDGTDRLAVECLSNDQVRWVAHRHVQDGQRISAAGTSPVAFLRQALQPYAPEGWFG